MDDRQDNALDPSAGFRQAQPTSSGQAAGDCRFAACGIFKHFLVVEPVETLASSFSCSQALSTPAPAPCFAIPLGYASGTMSQTVGRLSSKIMLLFCKSKFRFRVAQNRDKNEYKQKDRKNGRVPQSVQTNYWGRSSILDNYHRNFPASHRSRV